MYPLDILEEKMQLNTIIEFLQYLQTNHIFYKIMKNLILVFSEYNYDKNNFQKYYNSLIIDINKKKIITYTYPEIINIKYINNKYNDIYSTEYQGIPITVFNNNNKWFLSTKKNIITEKNKIHYLYEEIIKKLGFYNVYEFYKTLNKAYSYYFIIVHYNNKYYKDTYISLFGDKYMFLYLISIKNDTLHEVELNLYDISKFDNKYIKYVNIINYNDITDVFKNNNISSIIVKRFNEKQNIYDYYRYNNYRYLDIKYKNHNELIYNLFLYHNNMITKNNFIELNDKKYNAFFIIKDIINHLIYELTYLYYLFWSNYDNYNIKYNKELYICLPQIYKIILFKIKGRYINDTLLYMNCYNEFVFDLKSFLKSFNIEFIINILKKRKTLNIFNDIQNIYYKVNDIRLNNVMNNYI